MCDQEILEDFHKTAMSRRQFGAMGAGASLVAVLPKVANAAEVKESEVTIKTPDGTCDAHFVHPVSGATAAVLVWPDIFGLRDPFRQMGKRLAESSYAVLTVNPFYRVQKAPTAPPKANFQDPATRESLMKLAGGLNATTHVTDAKAFVAWLDSRPEVDKRRKIGTTGYCMGGPIVFRTAGNIPERIGAAGSFHGGGLNTQAPDSPHLLIPKMKANVLVAIAKNDDARDPESKNILEKAFTDAKVAHHVEVFPADHGWCPPDGAVYDQVQAERAWSMMLDIFKKQLA